MNLLRYNRVWKIGLALILCLINTHLKGQQVTNERFINPFFEQIEVFTDSMKHRFPQDALVLGGKTYLPLFYTQEDPIVEFRLYPGDRQAFDSLKWDLLPSGDYELLDEIRFFENRYYKFRLRFNRLSLSDFLSLAYTIIQPNGNKTNFELPLFPYTQTRFSVLHFNEDLYVGELKRYDLVSNQLANLKLEGNWIEEGGIEYRAFEQDGKAYIEFLSHTTGVVPITLTLPTHKPFLDPEESQLRYISSPFTLQFNVKSSRLAFLRIDEKDIIMEQERKEEYEIQIDNHRNLQINKTYRIENQEEKGGRLVAELYTVRRLSNDKVLSYVRPYKFHQSHSGFLYIKDNDQPVFLTNFNILPEARIFNIMLLRNGENWSATREVKPGEVIDVRIEGVGLNQAQFHFEDMVDLESDTLIANDNVYHMRIKVPIGIRKRSVALYNNHKNTGHTLSIVEHKRAKPLDFVYINYGNGKEKLTQLTYPVFHKKTIKDVVISFDLDAIDTPLELFGRQHLEIDIRVTGTRNELIEMKRIEGIVLCPGANSPRHAFYQASGCYSSEIRLNEVLNRATHSLDEWSKIEFTIRHNTTVHTGEAFSKKSMIVLEKPVTFDVDLSFPAGLLIKKIGDDQIPALGGISLAMIAQFSFYQKNQIRRTKPYKIGAGFLAQNAFNFNPEAGRDLGLVIIGSVYPTRPDARLSFPLYGGVGFFLNENKFFYLIGPGIRVNF